MHTRNAGTKGHPGSGTYRRAVLAVALLLGVAVAGRAQAWDDAAVVARVNGVEITVKRFQESYVERLLQSGRNDTPGERHAHLEDLIDVFLLAEAARERGMESDEAYQTFVNLHIKKAVANHFYGTAFLDSLPDVTEAELRTVFRNSRAKVFPRHLLFPTREAAEAAHARLEAGTDFVQLANELYNTAAFDATAGYLGETGYWELEDAFSEAAFSLPVGAYSEPVRTRYGWHLIKVEKRIDEPILTEDQFTFRRKGLLSQTRQRRMRMEGDRFVRAFMEAREVAVAREGMAMLNEALRRSLHPAEPSAVPPLKLKVEEVAAVREALTPETVLATYTFGGERHTFTAGNYAEWLPELPYDEVRNRPAASVGRALRNEVMTREGFARGFDADPAVLDYVQYHAANKLAGLFRDHLRATETATPTEEELREGFERLHYRRLKTATADYWRIPFATFAEAEAARQAILSDPAAAATFVGFQAFSGADLTGADPLFPHLRRTALNEPVVIGLADDRWIVAHVAERTLVYTTFEEARPDLEALLSRSLPEIRLLETLRVRAQIEVDPSVFEQVMTL